jgi:putative DNA primase/helicase
MQKVEGVLKQVVSGQRLNVERKYENTQTGQCTARVVFVTNSLPAFSDLSDAIFRRTVIIPFLERIPLAEQDPTLTNRIIATELPAIFQWGVAGLADVLTHGVFESPASLEMKKRHFAACNRERDFLNTGCERHSTSFVSTAQLYANYRVWSAECDHTPISLSAFCQTIETAFPEVKRKQRSIEGERVRGYEGIRFVPGDHPENIPNPRPDPETELVISSE